jgi:hypothetical protein
MGWRRPLLSGESATPLAVSSNGRYVQDAFGAPFLLHAEAAWFLQCLSLANAIIFLDDCVAKGVNCLRVLVVPYWEGAAVANGNGDHAFTTPNDFTTAFVAAYWNHLEAIIAAARARGIILSLVPLYYGFGGDGTQGWWLVVNAKSAAQSQAYGVAVATRFQSYTNIIWEGLGDFVPTDNTRSSALIAGLRSVSPARLCTAEPVRDTNSDSKQPSGGNWDLNFIYPTQAAYVRALAGWNANVGPCWTGEPYYEWRTGPDITLRQVRASMWFAATYGSPLYCYGNERIWDFDTDRSEPGTGNNYTAALNNPGRLTYKAHGEFLRTIEWWRLAPDSGSSLVTSSRGTNGSETYVTVSKSTGPQNLALIYIPSGNNIPVAMSGFTGPVTATWVDPANGATVPVSGSPFAASGSQSLNAVSALGNNSAGDPDRLLLLAS